ncbi:MAG TPA: transporter, partial [Geminicoccaceae bacterium]|nr:transporter [Geminicoccaceae bacterium]
EEAVERALERTLVQTGVLLLPFGKAEIEPSFSYSHGEQRAPVFVSNGGSEVFIGEDKVRRDEAIAGVDLRIGLPFDAQAEFGLPYNWAHQDTTTRVGFADSSSDGDSGHGLGDLRIGAAKTLLRERGWLPDLVARVWWDTATGETRDNDVVIGSGFHELGGGLSAVKRQDPLAFVGQLSYEHTLENDGIQPGDALGFSLGMVLAASPETSLRASFSQRFRDDVEVDGRTIAGSDRTTGTLNLGASLLLGRSALLDLGVDVGVTDDAPDYVVRLSLPMRFNLPML